MQKKSLSSVRVFYPKYNREQLITLLREQLPRLKAVLPFKRIVLFGSWAVGRETAFSDIDLLVVYEGSPREEAYKLVRSCLKVRGLEPHVYSEGEAEQLSVTLERMTRKSITLFAEGQF